MGYRTHVSISAAFHARKLASVKVKLRRFRLCSLRCLSSSFIVSFVCLCTSQLAFFFFLFFSVSDGTWICFFVFLHVFSFMRKEGRSVETLFFNFFYVSCSVSVFAYNSVRTFKWRDIYRIIVKLVRCFSKALSVDCLDLFLSFLQLPLLQHRIQSRGRVKTGKIP